MIRNVAHYDTKASWRHVTKQEPVSTAWQTKIRNDTYEQLTNENLDILLWSITKNYSRRCLWYRHLK